MNTKKHTVIIILTVLLLLLPSCISEERPSHISDTEAPRDTTGPAPDITAQVTDYYETIPLLIDTAAETGSITETGTEPETAAAATEEITEAPEIKPEFKADLSAYEKYFDPEDAEEYLILVNPDNPMTDHKYKPSDLTKLVDTREGRSTMYMREYAAMSFEAFMIEARANDCKKLSVTSAFRSYSDQEHLFQYYVDKFMAKGMTEKEAIAATRLDTAYPGESEHQTGLAVDVHNLSSASQSFGDTYEAKWMAENCWKFGFILRYLEGKDDITGYIYEPWHFRYVGRTHAKRIYDMELTLEEYLEYLKTE